MMKHLRNIVFALLVALCLVSCKKPDNKASDISVRLMSELIQERNTRLMSELQADEIIGSWTFTHFQIGGTITIYKKDNQFYCYSLFSDNSKRTESLSKESEERYYVIENGKHNQAGEYYLVSKDGFLTVCDNEGNVGWNTKIAY